MNILTALLARIAYNQRESLDYQRRRDAEAAQQARKEEENRNRKSPEEQMREILNNARCAESTPAEIAEQKLFIEEMNFFESLSKSEQDEWERLSAADAEPSTFFSRNPEETVRRFREHMQAIAAGKPKKWRTLKAANAKGWF